MNVCLLGKPQVHVYGVRKTKTYGVLSIIAGRDTALSRTVFNQLEVNIILQTVILGVKAVSKP